MENMTQMITLETLMKEETFLTFLHKIVDERVESKIGQNIIVSNRDSFLIGETECTRDDKQNIIQEEDEPQTKLSFPIKKHTYCQSQGAQEHINILNQNDEEFGFPKSQGILLHSPLKPIQNKPSNTRSMSEPQMKLERQRLISQISGVLIGISQSRYEEEFQAAIGSIQNNLNSIQRRISVLEVNLHQQTPVQSRNISTIIEKHKRCQWKLNDQQSQDNLQDNGNQDLQQVNIKENHQSQLQGLVKDPNNCRQSYCLEQLQGLNQLEIRVIEMHKAIEEKMLGIIDKFKEYIEENLVNIWQNIGFLNTKTADLEQAQAVESENLQELYKKTNNSKRSFFGF